MNETLKQQYSDNIINLITAIQTLNTIAKAELDTIDVINDDDETVMAHLDEQDYFLNTAKQLQCIVLIQLDLLKHTIR